MKLSYEEIEGFLGQVTLASKLYKVKDKDNNDILLYFSQPSRKNILLSDYHYEEALIKAKKEGLPSIKEMDELLVKRGFWGPEKEKEIQKLESQIKGQKGILAKTTRVLARRERLETIIKDLEEKVRAIKMERELRLHHTAERKAEEEKMLYLSWVGILSPPTYDRYWLSIEDFKNEKDLVLRASATLEYTIFFSGLPSKTIRYLARSPSWVVRYMAAQKISGKLFDREVFDYSVDQINISYWSSFYTSLHEMMPEDRPPEDIVEDDEALDAFMEEYFKQRKDEDHQARMRKSGGKGASAFSHSEVLVMKSNPMYEDIDYTDTPNTKERNKGTVDVKESKR